ncbi:hypothetical protein CVIRNUC_011093 [Coccomyxa viridis]|uniref:peptidylprolyl isomerase n=1 Tax=Coccomyxa viridis TaxID=1274662 RepID=A0AAV1IM20_9CHLO|nr:hypothetical protein CVIRNUC_011093 [Coccomyxa viridis]
MQTFYGVEVTPGKTSAFVPPPIDAQLHLSQATLSLDAKDGERVGVTAKVDEDGPDVLICSLREGASESQSLDLIFDSYAEFKVVGSASVHLSGYYMPEHGYGEEDDKDDDEDTDEDEELDDISPEDLRALAAYGRGAPRHVAIDSEEEGDSDEDDEEYDDDEDDEDDDEDEDDELARKDSGIIITELNHDGSDKLGTDEDEDDDDDEDDDEEPAPDAIQIDEDIAKKGGIQIDVGVPSDGVQIDAEGAGKRKGAGAEAQKSKRAKKAADVAVAAAKDAIAQAAAEEEPEGDEEEMIDVAAATDAPSMEEEAAQVAAVAEEAEEAAAAARPVSKKAKKRAAKEAAAKAQAEAAPTEPASKSVPIKHTRPKVQKFDNGFIIEDTAMGPAEGKEAKPGNKVGVRYKGWLAKTNKVFDQTKGSKTFNFRVGVGEVIEGWDRGVVGMRPGDKRRLTVPPQMAYGTAGVKGAIPANATLVFEVELVDIKAK